TGDLDPLLEVARLRFGWRLDTLSLFVVLPAVIRAAKPIAVDHAAGQRGAAMRAPLGYQAEGSIARPKQRQALAEQLDGPDRRGLELSRRGDGVPETAHVAAHRRARPNEGETVLALLAVCDLLGCRHRLTSRPVIGLQYNKSAWHSVSRSPVGSN